MNSTLKALLLIVALAMSFPGLASAQTPAVTALNQVRLAAVVTDPGARTITLTVADNVSVGDVIYVDQEAMVAQAVNTTTDVVTVARGAMGTNAAQHLSNAIVYTGAANRFYFSDPKAGRCVPAQAYPGGAQPWINVITGDVWYCNDNLYGRTTATGSNWQVTNLYNYQPSVAPYTAIAFRTGGSPPTTNTPAYTVKLTDALIASLTYSGPFEVFLPVATGLLGKEIVIADFAGLAQGSPGGRTITIRGVIGTNGTDNSIVLATAGAATRLFVGISSTSAYSWFAW